MKRKLFAAAILFSAVIITAAAVLSVSAEREKDADKNGEYIAAVNEIERLAEMGEYEKMSEKAAALRCEMAENKTADVRNGGPVVMCAVSVLFVWTVFGYAYFGIICPFERLKAFASEISKGNFDVPLNFERSNYFGEFTWAFDSMRREVAGARTCECEAIENNKTVIAALSHDIKTPVASIRAYSEALEAGLDGTPEKRRKYLDVIMKKCDEVSRLTDDLLLHSLSYLDKLEVSCEKFELCSFMETAVEEIIGERGDVHFKKPDFEIFVNADKKRLVQMAENLINNAGKYAGTDIEIFILNPENEAEIHFRDFGKGIPDEDMPFIFDKFYRGKNSGGENGSGLGLYIVKYIAVKMKGRIALKNLPDGLDAVIILPCS